MRQSQFLFSQFTAVLCGAAVAVTVLSSSALGAVPQIGPRMALRLDPDQVVLGANAHLATRDLGNDQLRVVALGSVGFGDDTTVWDGGLDLQVLFTDSPLAAGTFFYAGVGSDLSVTHDASDLESDTLTRVGLMLTGGVERRLDARSTLFGEFRMHIHEPGEWFEVAVGMNFAMPR